MGELDGEVVKVPHNMWAVGKYIGELRSAKPEPISFVFRGSSAVFSRWHIVNDDIAIERWFDDFGKKRVSVTAGYEPKGF